MLWYVAGGVIAIFQKRTETQKARPTASPASEYSAGISTQWDLNRNSGSIQHYPDSFTNHVTSRKPNWNWCKQKRGFAGHVTKAPRNRFRFKCWSSGPNEVTKDLLSSDFTVLCGLASSSDCMFAPSQNGSRFSWVHNSPIVLDFVLSTYHSAID